uniref:Suppressor of cytokine signaling 7 n=1 Tax=Mola mola TaxID=94237 RepID=A0A3Q3WUD3_MOLML
HNVKNCPAGGDDPVLALARRLGQLGEGREEGGGDGGEMVLPLCSCHSVLASGTGGLGPGEDPSETSDALLVLEGLGSGEVGGLGEGGDGGYTGKGESNTTSPRPYPPTRPQTLQAAARFGGLQVSHDPPLSSSPDPSPRSQPQSCATTPKVGMAGRCASPLVVLEGEVAGGMKRGEKTPRGKSRKGGSLKVRLSKLFRTKSSTGGSGGLLDKRPSLASSTSSGGSLLDVWGSTCSNAEQEGSRLQVSRPHGAFSPVPCTPAFTGETVSLVDVDISRRGRNSLHPPTPPPPPRRSLSLLGTILFPLLLLLPRHVLLLSAVTSCCGWYWGPMNWEDAEMKLKGIPDGSFLVRDSSDPRYILSLSFRSQGVTHHTRMEHYRGTFSLWCHPKFEDRCHSVVEFIERAIMHSKNGKFLYFLRSRVPGLPPTPVQLLYPVSRFSIVKSLQHLCRFCIRQLVRIDHIQELPLPTPLISYLRKFYYYDPEEEIHPSLKERGAEPIEQERTSGWEGKQCST